MHRLSALCLALLSASAPWVAVSGCTSAGLCTRGEPGCACDEGRCDQGRCDENDRCVEREEPPDNGNGRDAGAPVECSDDSLDSACQDFCEAFCQNQVRLCEVSTCRPGDCEPGGELLQVCYEECSSPSCAQRSCESQLEHTCESFGYLDPQTGVFLAGCFDSDPRCVLNPSVGCSDTCGDLEGGTGGGLADNGSCEDGGEDADEALCPRTTDCTDCGVRECAPAGESCEHHRDCCDFVNDGAFCVEVTDERFQCLTTCTETRSCPGGAECVPVEGRRNFVCAP